MAAPERAFVIVAVVADFVLPCGRLEHAMYRVSDAATVVRAFVLVVAILVGPALHRLFVATADKPGDANREQKQHKADQPTHHNLPGSVSAVM
jgi:hypothetical protein